MAADARILEQYVLRPEASTRVRVRRSLFNFIRRKPLGAFCALIVVLLIVIAAFPQLFTRYDPNTGSLLGRYYSPSSAHWFGTDNLGRDYYTRIIYGARTSIIIGFGVVAISTGLATVLGVVSGYFVGWIDGTIQRFIDIGIALPGLVFVILFVTSLQQIPLILRIVISVGFLISMGNSRIVRGATIATRSNQYVEAARVLGASDLRIIFRHLLPNVFAIVIITASIQIGAAILIEAALSFLGYGVQPPTADWGYMVTEAQQYLTQYPFLAIFPGVAIFITVFSFNMFGDAMRDVLDPRLRGTR